MSKPARSDTNTIKNAPPLSVTVGGRIVSPALPIVDASPPNAIEQQFDAFLSEFSDDHIPLESVSSLQTREIVLTKIKKECRDWIRSVCLKVPLPPEAVNNAGGDLFTSGSYRLGVHEPGADIDTILVAPNICSREDFFGSGYIPQDYDGESDLRNVRDPDSLAERIRRHPDVTNFVPVEGAAVPILTFDWEGINIDLLFARLNSSSVPTDFDIDNDSVLDGVDSATEKSLNGPRVTNLIAALVRGTPQRYETFLKVVRCVRKWAKARGLYSNKMGYWGGVNINIAVALVIQLYPNDCAANLLRKFFLVFKSWRWPNPILLTKPHDAGLGLPVWNAHHVNNLRQVAPVITPAYPAMNSTLSVSRQTLQILHEEFCRGHEILDRLWKDHQQGKLESGMSFQELFQPSDFFISYPLYLSICIVGPTESDAQSWTGFVESRMRKLVSDMLGKSLPLSKIQLWPKKVDACVADRTALLTHDQRKNSVTYFVGFHVDKLRMRGNQLDIERQMQNFSQWELSRFQPLIPGMDVLVKNFKVKELPLICFEIYEGGKFEAMRKRRKMRDADPRRQQAKKNARLEELNARLEEMKRKKQEAINAKEKKRKREENEEEEEGDGGDANANSNAHAKAECEEIEKEKPPLSAEEAAAAQEEEALLENALDAIQNETGEGKTREEAEQDRQKLLSGELLVEGGGDEDEDALAYGPDGLLAGEVSQEKVLSIAEREAEVLRKSGYTVVSEDEFAVVGGNMVLPWRIHAAKMSSAVAKKERSRSKVTNPNSKITFKTKFDVVELDADGFVIDKGDDDFSPTPIWLSRRPGFEFKLGERGLGYYRTGKKVVVPSHTAY
jgi:poly(A) polymerase